jgi:hypothetical protein
MVVFFNWGQCDSCVVCFLFKLIMHASAACSYSVAVCGVPFVPAGCGAEGVHPLRGMQEEGEESAPEYQR